MEKDTYGKSVDLDAKPLPPIAEPISPPTLILQAVGGAHLELNHALDEYHKANYSKAEAMLVKLKANLERLVSHSAETGSVDSTESFLLYASTATALGRTYKQLKKDQESHENFELAVALFTQWLSPNDKGSPQNYSDFGIALYMVGRRDEAIATLQRAISLGSKSAETFLYLGICLEEQQQHARAETALKEAVATAPADPLANSILARSLEAQGPERYSEAAQSYYAAAFAMVSKKRLDDALTALEHALKLVPNSVITLELKGETLRLLGRNEEALAVLNQALELDTGDFQNSLLMTKGATLQALGHPEEALRLLNDILIRTPDDATALGFKGQALHALSRNQEGLETLKKAVELDSRLDWVHAELGSIQFDIGNYAEALDAFDQALNLNADYLWALWLKGESLRALGRYNDALRVLNRALSLGPNSSISLMTKSDVLRLMGRQDEALQIIDHALELSPDSAYALGTKGQILHELKQNDEAVKVLKRSVERDPNLNWAYLELATTLRDLGRLSEALDSVDRALELKPDDPWTLYTKGQILNLLNKQDEAIPFLQRAIERNPKLLRAYVGLSEALIAAGKYEESLRIVDQGLDEALYLNPDDVSMMVIKGRVLNGLGRYDDAIDVLQRCVFINPRLDQAYAELGDALLAEGRSEEALQAINQALALNENNASALGDKGQILSLQGHQAEAIEILRRAVDLDPDQDWTFVVLGDTLRRQNRPEEALKALDEALKLEPNNAFALAMKGLVMHSLSKNDEALEALKRAVELDPGLGWGYATLGLVWFDLRLYEESLRATNEALKLDANNVSAQGIKAKSLHELGRYEEAQQAIQQALDHEPENVWLLNIKGKVLNALGEYDEALKILEQALTREPNDATALRHKGIALLALNRNEEALETFEQALSIDPENSEVMTATAFTLLFDDKYNEDKLKKAQHCLDQALAIAPESAWAWSIKGTTLCDLAEYEHAIDALNQAIQLDPSDVDSHTYKGWACQCLAASIMQQALERETQFRSVFPQEFSLKEWASRCDVTGHLQRAEEAYNSGLEGDPHNLWCQKGLGNIRYLLGDREGADQIYESVLRQAEQGADLDASALSLMGWCKFRLRQYDEAIRLFIENQSLLLDVGGLQFDLALALLCNKQYSLGLEEYKRGVSLAVDRPQRRCRGLISVARNDLWTAVMAETTMWSVTEVRNALQIMRESVNNPSTPALSAS